jgi:hypothetical protein
MNIVVERLQCDDDVTISGITVDGDWQCWGLEDPVREVQGQPVASWKVYGKTAIPAGRYKVELTMSARFKRILPILLDVPGFEGVRIHAGNTAADTEGCILVGNERLAKSLARSQLALAPFMAKMAWAQLRGEKIILDIA